MKLFNPFKRISELEAAVTLLSQSLDQSLRRNYYLEKHFGIEFYDGKKQRPHYRKKRVKKTEHETTT